jgi:uncharacterized LabA/DUF88 family protein
MPARSDDTYLFIDGEYLRRIYNAAMQSVFQCDGEINFQEIKEEARAKRVFFYDCIDDEQRGGESVSDYQKRIGIQEAFFDGIAASGGFHVRLGSIRGAPKKRRQKEVDVLLAVDMLTHGFDGNMEKAILIAGDLDFRPVVESLVRAGVFVEVWYEASSAARELPGAADFGRKLGFSVLYRWSSPSFLSSHEVPQSSRAFPFAGGGLVARTGSCDGRKVQLIQVSGHPEKVLHIERADGVHYFKHPDAGVLERYLHAVFGWVIDWDAGSPKEITVIPSGR